MAKLSFHDLTPEHKVRAPMLNLRRARVQLGWSQEDFAEAMSSELIDHVSAGLEDSSGLGG